MKKSSTHQQVTQAVNDGWMVGGSFFASIMSGFLLGYFADKWLGTEPWLVILGIVIGAYSGFLRLWHYAKQTEESRGR
ncbi:MAG: AtpZ/AtpI family protein [Acidimicrobiia bacterium]|nr:AtpZ/AtpI family protein [Acidimicrobiia bacterium]